MIPLYDTLRSRRFPIMNWILIGLNFVVFVYELSLSPAALDRFTGTWGLVPAALINHPGTAWVTIFSAMFIHGGWFHILSNMWVLFIFGDNIEDRLGAGRYLVFYLLSGIAAGLLESLVLARSSAGNVPTIGASGAIAGVLGAYLVSFPRAHIASLVPIFFIFTIIEIPAALFLLFWFVLQLFSGFFTLQGASGSGIAWWAHVGGFLFGMLAVNLFAPRRAYYLTN